MSQSKIVEIDGVKCAPVPTDSEIRIVILQRGNVIVGRYERDGQYCKLHDASVIRLWGTTRGLGELAANGPTANTKLDPCNGLVEFHELTVVCTIACNPSKWAL